jgi:thiol-disulfide isomerase/thioredoxin
MTTTKKFSPITLLLTIILITLIGKRIYFSLTAKYLPKTIDSSIELMEAKDEGYSFKEKVCLNEKPCLFLFVAPWCSDCKKVLPNLFKLKQLSATATLNVIIGEDSLENCRSYSENFTPLLPSFKVWLDPEGKLFDKLNVRYVPQYILTNLKLKDGKLKVEGRYNALPKDNALINHKYGIIPELFDKIKQ